DAMSSDVENRQPTAKLAEIGDIFSRKLHSFNPDNYNIYHFEELTISGRKYLFRPSVRNDMLTVVLKYRDRMCLLVSMPCPSGDPAARIHEIHQYVMQSESAAGV
ncbi:hypothetical protein BOX15_Mlig012190g2, partial [Macrostomum lignano]